MKNVLQKKMEKGDLWNLQEKRHDQELFQSSCFIKYYIWNFSLSNFFLIVYFIHENRTCNG